MIKASESINISVTKDDFIRILIDFDRYPDFLNNIKSINIIYNKNNKYRVKYHIKIIKNIYYTLEFEFVNDHIFKWKLLEGNIMKKNEGYWEITEINNSQIRANYKLEIDLKTPLPKAIFKKIIKSDLPDMLNRFKKYAENLYG